MNKRDKIVVLALLFHCWMAVMAQPVNYLYPNNRQALVYDVWANAPGDTVWAATNMGLVRFTDFGNRQQTFNDTFNARRVVGNGNQMWFAGTNGLAIYNNGHWSMINHRNGYPNQVQQVQDMILHKDNVWLLIDGQLYRLHRNQALIAIPRMGHFLASAGDTLYLARVGTGINQPVFSFYNETWDTLPAITNGHFRPSGLSSSSKGVLHVSRSNGQIFRYVNNLWESALPPGMNITSGGGSMAINDSIIYMQAPNFSQIIRLQNHQVDTLHTEMSKREVHTTGVPNGSINFRCYHGRIYKMLRRRIMIFFPEMAVKKNGEAVLDINNIHLSLTSNGRIGGGLLHDKKVRYGNLPLINEISPWLQLDHEGSTYIRTSLYKISENDLYFSGPYGNRNDSAFIHRYDHVWMVSEQMIENHKLHYTDSNYIIPEVIANWPAAGSVSNNEALQLAPYVDVNNNGIYDPENGDYPLINGQQALYAIFSPRRGNTGSMHDFHNLRMEIHLSIFAYDSLHEPELQNSVFLNYRVFNRSSSDYKNVKLSLTTFFDETNYTLIGSDSTKNSYFAYPRFKTIPEIPGAPPAITIGTLDASMDGFMYFYRYQNQGTFAFHPPVETSEYLNLFRYRIASGRRVRFDNPNGPGSLLNGTGFGAGINLPLTNWLFNASANWYHPPFYNDAVVGLPIYLLGDIPVKSSACATFALVAKGDSSISSPELTESLNLTHIELSKVRQKYAEINLNCNQHFLSPTKETHVRWSVYPNPSTGIFKIKGVDENSEVKIFNAQGQVINAPISRKYELSIDLSNHPAGIYFVKINKHASIKLIRME
ncbi:MAG: T9SS type A sorting domain-containing protein [Cryomorphaceae bacterium]|nr:T9SS type A sorting domain-containing protein [Cryomorphaceae bacterium]